MTASADVLVLGTGLVLPGHPSGGADLLDLPAPLCNAVRRMDRFARTAFLAGCRAAMSGGLPASTPPDPTAGVLIGTSLGCRDSITVHAALVRQAASGVDLRPAVFAQTVHNAPCGELAIAWGLGGVSETLVSGGAAGLEALLLGSWKVADGTAETLLAGGAEGVTDELRSLWTDRGVPGRAGPALPLVEAAGALLVASPQAAGGRPPLARVAGGGLFRETTPASAAARIAGNVASVFPEPTDLLVVASPDAGGVLAGAVPARKVRDLAGEIGETLGAAGAVGAVLAVLSLAAGAIGRAVVVARDEAGGTAFLLLERPRTP